jgi:hypothetical protein
MRGRVAKRLTPTCNWSSSIGPVSRSTPSKPHPGRIAALLVSLSAIFGGPTPRIDTKAAGEVGIAAPGSVRIASALAWAMLAAGLLLVVAGIAEMHWWGTSAPARLSTIFADIEHQHGPSRPRLLRGHAGAAELVVVGVASLVCAGLARLLARGRRWARTVVLVASAVLFLDALLGIGADTFGSSSSMSGYIADLEDAGFTQPIPEITSLLYPTWYSWVEDIGQELQLVLSLACFAAASWAVLQNADYFTTRKADEAGPDEWDAAISRIHRRTVGGQESS